MGDSLYANGNHQIISVDLTGPSPLSSQGNRYILYIVDHYSLWTEAYPLPDNTNKSVWNAFANYYLSRFSAPLILLSDNGSEFIARDWEDYLKSLGIDHRRTTAYHTQCNGRSERWNQTLKRLISKAVANSPHAWEDKLGDCLFAYRIRVSSVTRYSPYFLLYGCRPRVPLSKTLSVRSNDFFGNRLDNLASTLQHVRVNTEDSRPANRARLLQRANAGILQKGDYVLLKANERITFSSRFDPLWIITKIRGSTLWLLQQQTGQIRKVRRSKVKLADPDIAWDSIPPRPKRKQAPAKRMARQQPARQQTPVQQVVTPDPGMEITVPEEMSKSCEARVPTSIPLDPPMRLMKCMGKRRKETITGDRKREAHIRHTKSVRDDEFNKRRQLRYDLRSSSHCLDAGQPLKRHNPNIPSIRDQKRAKWQVIALVSQFTCQGTNNAPTVSPRWQP